VLVGSGLAVGVGTVEMLRPLVGEGSEIGFITTFGTNCLLSSIGYMYALWPWNSSGSCPILKPSPVVSQ